jgi:hypothetical protein
MNFRKPISELVLISRSPENQVGGSVYLLSPGIRLDKNENWHGPCDGRSGGLRSRGREDRSIDHNRRRPNYADRAIAMPFSHDKGI